MGDFKVSKVAFTAGRIRGFSCPPDKAQAFLWDQTVQGLGLRATPGGKPSYVFQSEYQAKTLRLTIGSPAVWTIPMAQEKARELQREIDGGRDPRDLKRNAIAANEVAKTVAAAKAEADLLATITVGEVWAEYIEERRTSKNWGDWHYRDHVDKAKAGGLPSGRRGGGKSLTKPGPLAALMPLALQDLDQKTIERWAAKEGQTRATSARLAWRLLKVFLNWCAEHETYGSLLPVKNPATSTKAREALGKPGLKKDVLQREQLAPWFAAVQQLSNPTVAACIQIMLLTGARPREALGLRWEDINTQWKGIVIRDKVEGTREIPATPYMLHLLASLPRRNEWVFSSPTSASGRLSEPNNPHTRACIAAGLDGLTLHGLRRSFKSLTEWLEIPAGVVAQIQGHKPSATAEKHYTVRPLELLRLHHEKIEAWILQQAGVTFDATVQSGKLRAVIG
jgi:integrase